jgi:hypothetical protein
MYACLYLPPSAMPASTISVVSRVAMEASRLDAVKALMSAEKYKVGRFICAAQKSAKPDFCVPERPAIMTTSPCLGLTPMA